MQAVVADEAGACRASEKLSRAQMVMAGTSGKEPRLTCDLGLEGAATNVVGATVLDGDEVAARGHGGVGNTVALGAFLAIHLHFGGPVNRH